MNVYKEPFLVNLYFSERRKFQQQRQISNIV